MKSSGFSRKPLAARIRPKSLSDICGQQHLVGEGKPLRLAIERGLLHSMIFWGPPGTGKTTLANIIAKSSGAHFETLSAVLAGVKEIRAVVDAARQRKEISNQATVLFVDEIHRFNKSQQDAFLPHVEEGVVTLIGATTENPSFELNNALLSRVRVYVLKSLSTEDLYKLLEKVLLDPINGFGDLTIHFPDDLKKELILSCDGDARLMLNMLEILCDESVENNELNITQEKFSNLIQNKFRKFDKHGEYFHDQISALHKSVRGSNPDAALYWFASMLEAGCDPLYIARRVVRMASEDVGNADPRALTLALNAWDVQERLGSPEGELAIAQAVVYMACAAKSNAVYMAFNEVMSDVKKSSTPDVPLHLRNAPTRLMKALDYGKAYRYAHDEPHAYAANENYFPGNMKPKKYYFPVERGLEIKIIEKLKFLQSLDKKYSDQ